LGIHGQKSEEEASEAKESLFLKKTKKKESEIFRIERVLDFVLS